MIRTEPLYEYAVTHKHLTGSNYGVWTTENVEPPPRGDLGEWFLMNTTPVVGMSDGSVLVVAMWSRSVP